MLCSFISGRKQGLDERVKTSLRSEQTSCTLSTTTKYVEREGAKMNLSRSSFNRFMEFSYGTIILVLFVATSFLPRYTVYQYLQPYFNYEEKRESL